MSDISKYDAIEGINQEGFNKRRVLIHTMSILVGLGLGVLIGYLIFNESSTVKDETETLTSTTSSSIISTSSTTIVEDSITLPNKLGPTLLSFFGGDGVDMSLATKIFTPMPTNSSGDIYTISLNSNNTASVIQMDQLGLQTFGTQITYTAVNSIQCVRQYFAFYGHNGTSLGFHTGTCDTASYSAPSTITEAGITFDVNTIFLPILTSNMTTSRNWVYLDSLTASSCAVNMSFGGSFTSVPLPVGSDTYTNLRSVIPHVVQSQTNPVASDNYLVVAFGTTNSIYIVIYDSGSTAPLQTITTTKTIVDMFMDYTGLLFVAFTDEIKIYKNAGSPLSAGNYTEISSFSLGETCLGIDGMFNTRPNINGWGSRLFAITTGDSIYSIGYNSDGFKDEVAFRFENDQSSITFDKPVKMSAAAVTASSPKQSAVVGVDSAGEVILFSTYDPGMLNI